MPPNDTESETILIQLDTNNDGLKKHLIESIKIVLNILLQNRDLNIKNQRANCINMFSNVISDPRVYAVLQNSGNAMINPVNIINNHINNNNVLNNINQSVEAQANKNNINQNVEYNALQNILNGITSSKDNEAQIKNFFDKYVGTDYSLLSNFLNNTKDNEVLSTITSILSDQKVKEYIINGSMQNCFKKLDSYKEYFMNYMDKLASFTQKDFTDYYKKYIGSEIQKNIKKEIHNARINNIDAIDTADNNQYKQFIKTEIFDKNVIKHAFSLASTKIYNELRNKYNNKIKQESNQQDCNSSVKASNKKKNK